MKAIKKNLQIKDRFSKVAAIADWITMKSVPQECCDMMVSLLSCMFTASLPFFPPHVHPPFPQHSPFFPPKSHRQIPHVLFPNLSSPTLHLLSSTGNTFALTLSFASSKPAFWQLSVIATCFQLALAQSTAEPFLAVATAWLLCPFLSLVLVPSGQGRSALILLGGRQFVEVP